MLCPDELNLRRLAGRSWHSAHELYLRGRVLSIGAIADGVQGEVLGTQLYRTRVSFARGQLTSECTCPVGFSCKHGFAMALRWARDVTRGISIVPAAPRAPDDRARSAPVANEQVAGFASRDELLAWARDSRVDHVLALPAWHAVQHAAPEYRHMLTLYAAQRTLADLACCVAEPVAGIARHLAVPFAIAARAWLDAEAACVAEGLAEEASRPRRAPADAVAPLWNRLVELRREQRAHAVPRGSTRRRFGSWAFQPRELRIAWNDPDHQQSWYQGSPTARTVMLAFVNERPVLSCACTAEACTHRIALIDATLDVLADPVRREVAIQATLELLRPGWSRVLEVLERAAQPDKQAAVVEVWWQVAISPSIEVVPIVRKLGKRGTLTNGARIAPERLLVEYRELDPRDREIADLLVSHQQRAQRGAYPHRAMRALVGHPRVRDATGAAVSIRQRKLGLRACRDGDAIRLEPMLEGEHIELDEVADLIAYFERDEPLFTRAEDGGFVLIDVDPAVRTACSRIRAHGNTFPPEAHGPLLDAIAKLDGKLPVAVPRELMGVEHVLAPAIVVRARLGAPRDAGVTSDGALELEVLIRPAPGAPLVQPGEGPREVLMVRDGERGYVRRELAEEPALVQAQLSQLPLQHADGGPTSFRITSTDAALDLVKALEHPPAGIEAQWLDERPRLRPRFGAKALRVEVRREHDWFGLAGDARVGEDRLALAVLLDAARRQQRYVRVDAGSWIELSDALREQLQQLADHTHTIRNRLEVSLGAVPAVAQLRDAGAKVEAAPAWTLAADRLAAARDLEPPAPASLRKVLRPYQREGYAWLTRVAAWGAGACLADDMGLGKTLQAIAVLVDRAKLGPAIVLAPTSVTTNWVSELARFAPKLRAVVLTEQSDRAASLAQLGPGDVLVVSYGLLVRETERLGELAFATLIADEAQALKNAETRRAKAARRLVAEFRVALTGTPLENHLGELWSIFAIVFPGLLGSWEQFRTRFALPIERAAVSSEPADMASGELARASLARVLRPFMLRRTKGEVARELPARTEIEVAVEMSPEERELYEDARLAAVANLTAQGKQLRDEQQRFQVLAALTRLRLLASHPRLYDPTSAIASSKLQRVLELVEELREGGHRALIFSQFTKHLQLVRAELDRLGIPTLYLDGDTPAKERARRITAFQAGEAELFLISLKAGGTGINLTAADYVIHLDPWWNPAVEDQATDRAHRIGQTKPVTVYRLITRGTVEERIVAMHGSKRELVAQILDGSGAAAKISTSELLALLAEA